MSTAPSNSTWTIVVFWRARLGEFIFFDGSKSVPTIQATAVTLGVGVEFFRESDPRVFAGSAPAEHWPG